MDRLGQALEERLRLKSTLDELKRTAPTPGRRLWDSPAYSLGRLTLSLVLLLITSGVVLAFFYQPSAEGASASIQLLQPQAGFGGLVRGVHRWAALLLIAVTMLHGLRAWLAKAYRSPREFSWWLGLLLLLMVAGLGATGYLLRWDIKAFTLMELVVTSFSRLPLVGGLFIELLLGGSGGDTIPLHRGYAVHVWFLPTLLVALIALHLLVVARHGLIHHRRGTGPLRSISWAPAAGLWVVVIALSFTLYQPDQPVSATALTTRPHPDWLLLAYILPFWLFQGELRAVGTLLLPGLALLALVAIPKIDHAGRWRVMSAALALVGVLVVLSVFGTTAYVGNQVPHQGCTACHNPAMILEAPRNLSEFRIRDPDWLVFHLRQPVESSLTPLNPPTD